MHRIILPCRQVTGDHISSFSLAMFDQFSILSFVIHIFCKTDVVGVNAGVEGMGVIPAVIGNIGHHPPMGLHHQHNHYKQTNTSCMEHSRHSSYCSIKQRRQGGG